MGLEGFSMGNLGLNVELTSAQMAAQSEQLARRDSEVMVKKLDESAEDQGVKRKERENEEKQKNKQKKQSDDQDDEIIENEDEKRLNLRNNIITRTNNLTVKDLEKEDLKNFSLRMNTRTGLIELFNNQNEKVVESISAEDLMGLMSKLDSAAGVLVNRKI